MKIAQVCPRYSPNFGGVETLVQEISERMVSKGNYVEVLTTDPMGKLPSSETINGVAVRRFKSWAPNESYFISGTLRSFLRRHADDYDLLHAHNYHAFPAHYAAAAKRRKASLIFSPHYHGGGHTFFRNLLYLPYGYITRNDFSKCDAIVCVSEFEKNLLLSKFSSAIELKNQRISVVPNGIDKSKFENLKEVKKSRSVLYVGRLEKYKRVDILMRAIQILDKDVKEGSKFGLTIVGSGPEKRHLLSLSKEINLESNITFYENLSKDNLIKLCSSASVFVSLSQKEAFGIAIAEALAAGTPCVVAPSSALSEWIDNVNCFGVDDPNNPAVVAERIKAVAGTTVTDPRVLDWDEVAKRLLEIYESAVSS